MIIMANEILEIVFSSFLITSHSKHMGGEVLAGSVVGVNPEPPPFSHVE